MDSFFLWNLILSLVTGALWIIITTVCASKYGSKVGGFIGGLPSTTLVAFLFMGIAVSPAHAAQATASYPLAFGAAVVFLLAYAIFSRKGFIIGIITALSAWFSISAIISIFKFEAFLLAVLCYIVIAAISYFALERMSIPQQKGIRIDYSSTDIITKGLIGGITITFAVLISKIAGPFFGGIFAAFPAVFIATLFILYRDYGLAASQSIITPLAKTAMVTGVLYVIIIRYLYPSYGLVIGTSIAFGVSVSAAYILYARE